MQAKKDILTGKELSVQVESQIAVQNDLINQLEMVDFTAGVVLDTINQTLPDIKANFIDQISISTSLENLKNFKDSVDATRKMTITLQEETFENTQEIMLSIAEQGVGLQEADLVRMEKLAEKKAALGKKVSTKLIDNSRQLDEHLVRIKDMNAKNVSSFDHMAIQDLSPSSTTKLAEEKKAKKEEPVVMGGVKDIEMPESDIIDVEVS
jgi:Zn-dependent oligopeptidase